MVKGMIERCDLLSYCNAFHSITSYTSSLLFAKEMRYVIEIQEKTEFQGYGEPICHVLGLQHVGNH